MEKCMGCLGLAFGNSRRRNKLRYRVNYGNKPENGGIEFDNLMLNDDDDKPMNYGTTHHFVSQEEKEIIAKREYDKILEQQRKIDEQINRKTFEDEERLRIEEERYREAQREASRAVSAALKVQQYSRGSTTTTTRKLPDNSLYSIGDSSESDDDFESFLESVKTRSDQFRNNKSEYCKGIKPGENNNTTKVVLMQPRGTTRSDSPDFSSYTPREVDGIADGMSSDGSFMYDEQTQDAGSDNAEMEWDKFVNGLDKQVDGNDIEANAVET